VYWSIITGLGEVGFEGGDWDGCSRNGGKEKSEQRMMHLGTTSEPTVFESKATGTILALDIIDGTLG
jgi:hypothetical protein